MAKRPRSMILAPCARDDRGCRLSTRGGMFIAGWRRFVDVFGNIADRIFEFLWEVMVGYSEPCRVPIYTKNAERRLPPQESGRR